MVHGGLPQSIRHLKCEWVGGLAHGTNVVLELVDVDGFLKCYDRLLVDVGASLVIPVNLDAPILAVEYDLHPIGWYILSGIDIHCSNDGILPIKGSALRLKLDR